MLQSPTRFFSCGMTARKATCRHAKKKACYFPYPAATMLACTALSVASGGAPIVMAPSNQIPARRRNGCGHCGMARPVLAISAHGSAKVLLVRERMAWFRCTLASPNAPRDVGQERRLAPQHLRLEVRGVARWRSFRRFEGFAKMSQQAFDVVSFAEPRTPA